MTFKPAIWRPIAVGLGLLNLAAVGFAAGSAEPWHATGHAALALVFWAWAQRLKRAPVPVESGREDRIEVLEAEMDSLRYELNEAQERLDFTERLLAQKQESRRVDPER
jgi:hypothetical protein